MSHSHTFHNLEVTHIVWEHTTDPFYPYRAILDGNVLCIRLNDFPEEPLYSLLIDTIEIADFDEWPRLWIR